MARPRISERQHTGPILDQINFHAYAMGIRDVCILVYCTLRDVCGGCELLQGDVLEGGTCVWVGKEVVR